MPSADMAWSPVFSSIGRPDFLGHLILITLVFWYFLTISQYPFNVSSVALIIGTSTILMFSGIFPSYDSFFEKKSYCA